MFLGCSSFRRYSSSLAFSARRSLKTVASDTSVFVDTDSGELNLLSTWKAFLRFAS